MLYIPSVLIPSACDWVEDVDLSLIVVGTAVSLSPLVSIIHNYCKVSMRYSNYVYSEPAICKGLLEHTAGVQL